MTATAEPAATGAPASVLLVHSVPVGGRCLCALAQAADGRTVEGDYWPVLVDGVHHGDIWLAWDMSDRSQLEQHGKAPGPTRIPATASVGRCRASRAQATPCARILIVEDDPEAALFAVHVLANRGQFEVTHTADPAEALRLAADEHWNLLLTDLDLPGMTGLQLLAALRKVAGAPGRG